MRFDDMGRGGGFQRAVDKSGNPAAMSTCHSRFSYSTSNPPSVLEMLISQHYKACNVIRNSEFVTANHVQKLDIHVFLGSTRNCFMDGRSCSLIGCL